MPPLVSVVIPAYNHERFIGKTIESVLIQSVDSLELIIVDDGSTDKTAEVIQNFKDPRLIYVYQENQDAYNALNRGLSLATGDFISILNSDDVYKQNRLERLLAVQRSSGAQCLFSRVQLINDDDHTLDDPNLWWNQWYLDAIQRYLSTGDLYTSFLQRNFMVTTSNLFMTKEAVATVGSFCPLRYLHDYDYIFRLLLAFPEDVHFLHDEVLLCYRIHGSNTISEAAITGRMQDQEVILKYMLARIPEEFRPFAEAGTDRLMELERELAHEHRLREDTSVPGLRMQALHLVRACVTKLQLEGWRFIKTIKKG